MTSEPEPPPPAPAPNPTKWTTKAGAVIVGLSSVVAAIFAPLAFYRDVYDITFSQTNNNGEAITIDSPKPLLLSRCLKLTGTAPPQKNAELWVVHRGIGSADLFFHKASRIGTQNQWEADGIFLGGDANPDAEFEFYAFYVTEDLSRFMESIQVGGAPAGQGFYFTRQLPPNIEGGAPQLRAPRDPNPTAGCKPSAN